MNVAARPVDLGGVRISLISGGALRLDGGAMFGIIPKAIWSRACPADEQNRIQLACNCLLVEWSGDLAGRRAVVETGHGCKYGTKDQAIFAIDSSHWLQPRLLEAGVDPATITDVVLSHLHFDHAGGLTMPRAGGAPHPDDPTLRDPLACIPTFPNARVHVQRREFEDARANFGIMTMTYREENYAPIDAVNAWQLHDGDAEIIPGIRAWRTPGHTRGHHSILIEGRDRTAIFTGDVMPTRHHAGAPYNMAYDVLPLDNRESKRAVLAAAAAREWLIVLDHDPEVPILEARTDRSWFALSPYLGSQPV